MQRFFHGTTLAAWEAIQREKLLWGRPGAKDRYSYLTDSIEVARHFGEVILVIWYDPEYGFERGLCNKWDQDCWQLRVYEPILLCRVRAIE